MRVPLAVRHAISLPIREIPVSIRSGPNQGKKWSVSASGQGIASGSYERAPTFIKVDIEGAEALLLKGAASFLLRSAETGTLPLMLISVHSPALYRECREILRAAGYNVVGSGRADRGESEAAWDGDPDLLAIPEGRDVADVLKLPWFAADR